MAGADAAGEPEVGLRGEVEGAAPRPPAGASSQTCTTVPAAHRPSVEAMQADLVETGRARAGSGCSPQIHRLRWLREADGVLQPQICRREGPREQPLQIHRRGC